MALGLGLTFMAPHCAVLCVTFPLGWDKPVTAGPDRQQPGHPRPVSSSSLLLLCTLCSSTQTWANLCHSTAIELRSHGAWLSGCRDVVVVLLVRGTTVSL